MKVLHANYTEANICGDTFAELEAKYLEETRKYGVVRTECVNTSEYALINSGAIFGFDKNDKIIFGNAFSTYHGETMVICICARRWDFLIEDALKFYKNRNKRTRRRKTTNK